MAGVGRDEGGYIAFDRVEITSFGAGFLIAPVVRRSLSFSSPLSLGMSVVYSRKVVIRHISGIFEIYRFRSSRNHEFWGGISNCSRREEKPIIFFTIYRFRSSRNHEFWGGISNCSRREEKPIIFFTHFSCLMFTAKSFWLAISFWLAGCNTSILLDREGSEKNAS
ncbi:hypothetical protein KSP40_PGU006695 [Platanthera guangdongensis]|uniref:Uncharacterized protein n=1 Tax=Platanthera guangdongensis TaxID=2320717 RepID=A0ABR2LRF8_9ASPA